MSAGGSRHGLPCDYPLQPKKKSIQLQDGLYCPCLMKSPVKPMGAGRSGYFLAFSRLCMPGEEIPCMRIRRHNSVTLGDDPAGKPYIFQ